MNLPGLFFKVRFDGKLLLAWTACAALCKI